MGSNVFVQRYKLIIKKGFALHEIKLRPFRVWTLVGGVSGPFLFLFSSVLRLYSAAQAVLRCFVGFWPHFPKPKVGLYLTGSLMKTACTHEIFQHP